MKIKLVGLKSVYIPDAEKTVSRDEIFTVNDELGTKLLAQAGRFEEVKTTKKGSDV